MKYGCLMLGLAVALLSGCRTGTNRADAETVGEWSEVVDGFRGRLVVEPVLSGRGAVATVCLELQNLTFSPYLRKLAFAGHEPGLVCTVRDARQQTLPRWSGGVPWIYDFAQLSYPVTLPARSTLRLRVAGVTYHLLHDQPDGVSPGRDAWVLELDAPNRPWHLVDGDRASYFLGATFTAAVQGEQKANAFAWGGTLQLPPVKLPVVRPASAGR